MTYRIPTGLRRATFLALLILAGATTRVAADGAKPSTEAPAGIYGRVYAHDDQTKGLVLVPGATIELLDQAGKIVGQATSNDQGYYAIALKGGTYFYRVSAAGYQDENSGRGFSLQLTEGDAVLNFTLKKGTTDPNAKPPDLPKVTVGGLIGQVYEKTSDGTPRGVSGATVALRKVGSPRVLIVHTAAPVDGKVSGFELGSMEAGEWQITAWANGFDPLAPASVTVRADDQRDHDILLVRTPEPNPVSPVNPASGGGTGTFGVSGLRGVIALADASPGNAPPVRATIHRAGTRAASDPIKLTAEGNYQVGCPPGRYVVRVEAEGYLPRDSEVSDVLAGRYTTVNLRLERRPTALLVKVINAESRQPLGYATLRLRRPGEPLSKAATQNTDAAGQSLFKPVAAGDYQLLAGMAGFKPQGMNLQIKVGETNELSLFLTPDTTSTKLTVSVYDSEKRKLSEAAVQVRPAGQTALEGVTDSNGISQIKLVKPAQCVLTVSKPGYIQQQRQVVLETGENTQAFYLDPVRSADPTLTLLVTSAKSKAPLPGVELRIQPALPKASSLKTDANGAWNGTLPAPGRYLLELTMKGYQPWKEEVVASAGNTTRRVPLVPLDDPSPKTGRFVVAVIQAGDKAAVPGARVVMMPVRAESTDRFDGLTDAQGKVTSSPLAPETYTIAVEKDGYEPRKITSTLTPGDHPGTITLTKKTVTTPVPPKGVQLTLLILYPENKAPIAGAEIKVKRDGKDIKSGTSTEKGGYTCELPGPGAYTVAVTKADYEPSQTSVDVTVPGVTRTIYLKAAALAKYTINVLVLEGEGKDTVPIEGADVKIRNKKQEVVKTGRTSNLGRFRAEDLEAGVYTIEASKTGYIQKERPTSDITRGTVQTQVPLYRAGSGKPIEPPKRVNKHAAIVFSYAALKTGVAAGKLSLDEALKAARQDCGDNNPDSFGFKVHADEGDWCALAVGDNGVCGDGGKTAKQAKENALLYAAKRRITNPRIVVCVNADGEKEVLVQPQDVQKLLKAIRYAAIAISPSTKKTGVAAGKLSLDEAKKAALKDCNASDAVAVRWTFGANYCALAVGDNGYAAGGGEYAKEAREDALREAAKSRYTNPRIAVFVFSDDDKDARTQQPEVQKLLQQGRAAIAARNWGAAATAINGAAKLAPTDADVLRAREEYDKALEADQRQQAAKQKEDQQQQQVQAILKQGRAAIAAKSWKAADDAINSAAKLAPKDADVLRAKQEYDQAYAKAQKEDLARQKEEQALQQEVQKLVQQGRTATAAKNWQAAANAINNASKLAPKDADVLRAKQEYDQAYAKALADAKAKPKDLYAVLAISKSTGNYGYSNRQPTLDDAKKAAIKNCNTADAEVYIWVQDGWLAFALGDKNGYGGGQGPTAEKAKENALRECNKITTNGAIKLLVSSNE